MSARLMLLYPDTAVQAIGLFLLKASYHYWLAIATCIDYIWKRLNLGYNITHACL
jgi:hypothetical protein